MGSDKHDATYYGKCMIGGILACGLTHTAIVTPFRNGQIDEAASIDGAWPSAP